MISLEDQRLLAWFYFRGEWDQALSLTGERGRRRRRQLRLLAMRKAVKDALLARGESCASCASYRKGVCLAGSDFHGELRTKPHNLCTDWRPRV